MLQVVDLLTSFDLFCLFKEYMNVTYSGENVTAFLYLHAMREIKSPNSRRKRSTKFVKDYLQTDSPRQLNVTPPAELDEELGLTVEQINQLLQELEQLIAGNLVGFVQWKRYKEFIRGEYQPSLVDKRDKRIHFLWSKRRTSDDLLILHFQKKESTKI